MVKLVTYIQDCTGIDLTRPPQEQNLAGIDAAVARRGPNLRRTGSMPSALEAVYDGVVGVDRVRHSGFDRVSDLPTRMGVRELDTLAAMALKIRTRSEDAPKRQAALKDIACAAQKYKQLLTGERVGVAKQYPEGGTRHTLIRGTGGSIFEMSNSMTEGELQRFKRKTNMRISAIETPGPSRTYRQVDEEFYKVVLGEGGYGRARIARDIVTDRYVAVKKSHPFLEAGAHGDKLQAPRPSSFSLLPEARKAVLRRINDVLVLPLDERTCPSAKVDGLIGSLVRNGIERRELGGIGTAYQFSELGIGSLDHAVETLASARQHFEGVRSGASLSPAARKMMGHYVALFGVPSAARLFQSRKAQQQAQGCAFFNLPHFLLKDAGRNQKFGNTLAASALNAVHRLHEQNFSHNDLKPSNLILAQGDDGVITVKMIDIDGLEDLSTFDDFPIVITEDFSPPEADAQVKDRSSHFDAKKGDAFAMGICLLIFDGMTTHDAIQVSRLQTIKARLSAEEARLGRPPAAGLPACASDPKYRVRDAANISNPRSLREVAELMLQVKPARRLTPTQAVTLDFFKNRQHFLSQQEFSDHARMVVRFSSML